MSNIFKLPKGTKDILPSDISKWRNIKEKARRIFTLYNYKEICTPLFEDSELFIRSMGETSDVVQKQMLTLQSRKKSNAGDIESGEFSLRPEGTASVVRSYIQNNLDRIDKISKLFYIGPMFRGERPQKGRLRQFHQIGAEVLGPDANHPYLDAELIALNVKLLKSFGLKNALLKINSLGTLDNKSNIYDLLLQRLKPMKSGLCDDCQDRVNRNVFRVLDCKKEYCKKIVKEIGLGNDWLDGPSRKYYSRVKEALDSLEVDYIEDASLVRGLDYYTHTVFELSESSLGSQDALSAGGRYDGLVKQLGGPQVSAIGFALGIERVLLATENEKSKKEKAIKVYVVALDEISFKKSFTILNVLRNNKVSSDMSYKITSLNKVGSQYSFASKNEINFVILIGESEIENQVVRVKDMKNELQEDISVRNDDFTTLLNFINKGFGKYVTNAHMR